MEPIANSQVRIGKNGGRSYQLLQQNKECSFKLKQFEDCFDKLAKKEMTQANSSMADKEIIYLSSSLLTAKHIEGEQELSKASRWVRFLTWIRRISNLFRRSHLSQLRSIENCYLLPKEPSAEAKKLYERLVDKTRKHHIEILNKVWCVMIKDPIKAKNESSILEKAAGSKKNFEDALTSFLPDAISLSEMDPSSKVWILEKLRSSQQIYAALGLGLCVVCQNANSTEQVASVGLLLSAVARRDSSFFNGMVRAKDLIS
jgi:hypothetical protein